MLLSIDAGTGSEEESIDVVDTGGLQHVLVHQHTRCQATNVFALNVVDATDGCREVEHVVDAVSGTHRPVVDSQVDRSKFDLVHYGCHIVD